MAKLSLRKIGVIRRTSRLFNRYLQILTVLAKYGFGDLIERLKILEYIEAGIQIVSGKRLVMPEKLTRAERIRLAMEELGPTFIKLGQILSTRPDLIPVDLIKELTKLQDNVSPLPYSEIMDILNEELKEPVEHIFGSFEKVPLASASIGQVHRARLITGQDVAVKVQRPDIAKIIQTDLDIMLHLALFMENHIEEISLHRPVKIVEEFARILEREIDYIIEANHTERFAQNFVDDDTVFTPQVFREFTSERVLIMEFVNGVKISRLDELPDLDRKLITQRGARFFLKQFFDFGFFHADPHPGNIFLLPHNIICLIDYGMMGAVDKRTRENFVDMIAYLVQRDEVGTLKILLKITETDDKKQDFFLDSRKLERDIADFMNQHLYKPLKNIEIGQVFHQLMEIAAENRLRVPPDLFLMMKAFGAIEGIARQIDPDFDMIKHASPFIERIKMARYHPQRLADDAVRIFSELMEFIESFPKEALTGLKLLKQNKLVFNIAHRELESVIAAHERTSNKISFAIVIAALIIGSALIVIANIPPLFYGMSVIGILLFFAAAIMGVWLLFAIIRKGGL